jgi:hypothetical protein
MTTLPNGQYIPLPPPLHIPPHANITGSPIDAASTATINAQNSKNIDTLKQKSKYLINM